MDRTLRSGAIVMAALAALCGGAALGILLAYRERMNARNIAAHSSV